MERSGMRPQTKDTWMLDTTVFIIYLLNRRAANPITLVVEVSIRGEYPLLLQNVLGGVFGKEAR